MVNSNDYVEIEESHYSEIFDDYFKAIEEGTEEIPDEFKFRWISSYLEGGD